MLSQINFNYNKLKIHTAKSNYLEPFNILIKILNTKFYFLQFFYISKVKNQKGSKVQKVKIQVYVYDKI